MLGQGPSNSEVVMFHVVHSIVILTANVTQEFSWNNFSIDDIWHLLSVCSQNLILNSRQIRTNGKSDLNLRLQAGNPTAHIKRKKSLRWGECVCVWGGGTFDRQNRWQHANTYWSTEATNSTPRKEENRLALLHEGSLGQLFLLENGVIQTLRIIGTDINNWISQLLSRPQDTLLLHWVTFDKISWDLPILFTLKRSCEGDAT